MDHPVIDDAIGSVIEHTSRPVCAHHNIDGCGLQCPPVTSELNRNINSLVYLNGQRSYLKLTHSGKDNSSR